MSAKTSFPLVKFLCLSVTLYLFDLRANLAFIKTLIPLLNEFDKEGPLVRAVGVKNLEPLIVRISCFARREDVPVSSSVPRNLEKEGQSTF